MATGQPAPGGPSSGPSAPAGSAGTGPAGPGTATPQRLPTVVTADLAGVRLRLEVAQTPAEREVGLMGRTSVPAGTGMLFRFGGPVRDRFYMYRTLVPLVIAFVRDGTVVGTAQMTPCPQSDPAACPTYGPDTPYDTAVETAPETLPNVRPGDRLIVTTS